MKFSDISQEQWDELQPYLDTCVLPVTALRGNEAPYETTAALERLRDLLDTLEIPYKGRVVTYPAFHYADSVQADIEALSRTALRLKEEQFRYVIVACLDESFKNYELDGVDLILIPGDPTRETVEALWRSQL
ncbi:DUF2487 family protein [Paenibacillus turpanensis]|uniref:DUF2487 family protein n=1 Tax=Paenibacillus turpanensis TaxID=2689078 RepID=UPI00140C3F02|nr:DUF2487 family protein [Paenibacillus turpanensis]